MQVLPTREFHERVKKVQEELQSRRLDALLAFSDEAEPTNVRYLSDYWPSFETAAVLVPLEDEPMLLIGPESETYANHRSRIHNIHRILEFRESSEPEYPGAKLSSFEEVFSIASQGSKIRKLGIAGLSMMPVTIYKAIEQVMRDGEIVRADDILLEMRISKSENELQLLREAYRLADMGLKAAIDSLRPGMTEIQVAAVAEYEMLSKGAEATAYPFWCVSGTNTNQAISRSTYRKVKKNEIIQICVGARVGGYCSSVGRPVVIGKMPEKIRKLIECGAAANERAFEILRSGIIASEVEKSVTKLIKEKGFGDFILYGPCHGVGLMECEPPWIESTSTYTIQPNTTFAVDTFLANKNHGIRFENGARVTLDEVERLNRTENAAISV